MCLLARGGERLGAAVERAGQVFCWSWRRRESSAVAQILNTMHFFQSRTTLTRQSRKHSCTIEQNWSRT